MKKFASLFLYVFSIVLAVGIGMTQVGKEGKIAVSASALPPCNYSISLQPQCSTLTANLNDKTCSGTYNLFYTPSGQQKTNLAQKREGGGFCTSCTVKMEMYEHVASSPEGCTAN